MLKVGDKVRVIAKWSAFSGCEGTIFRVHPNGPLRYQVEFCSGRASLFALGELELV